MSPELVLYYDNKSIKSISSLWNISRDLMIKRLSVERKKLGMETRGSAPHYVSDNVMEFIEDKKLAIELSKSGMSCLDIASKWDISDKTVSKYLRIWGMVIDVNVDVDSVSLSELYTGWADIPKGKEMLLTVNKRPIFKLVRII